MKHSFSRLFLGPALAITLIAHPAHAQPKTELRESLAGEAATAFDEGTRLYKASDLTAAREAFSTAYGKSGDRRILYNVAVCDKALGQYARAIATLRTSLEAAGPPLPAEYTRRASESIATLTRYVAQVTVEASVSEATLTVDGEALRDNPVLLDAGTHTFVVTKAGFETATRTITVQGGETQLLRIQLEASPAIEAPIAAAPALTARLWITTERADDDVSVDGIGGRSGVPVTLATGEHHVEIKRQGTVVRTMDLLLRPDETREIHLTVGESRKAGLSPWWFIGGGVVVTGVAVALGVVLVGQRTTTYEGSSAGTLNPFVVPAGRPGGLR